MIDDPDIREQLAAFLAGELDGPEAEALQARIDAEPWVGALADDMADLLMALGGVDDVEPPPGFGDRLREGIETDLDQPLTDPGPDHHRTLATAGAAAATGWAERDRPRGSEEAPRPDRRRGRRAVRVHDALGVAAILAVLAVASVTVLTQFRGGTSGEESDPTVDSRVFDSADNALELDREDDGDAAGSTLAAPAAQPMAVPDGPVVLTLGTVADDDAIRGGVGGHPAASALLGTDASAVDEVAAAFRDELLRGPDFADDTPVGTCLADTLDAAGQDRVPAVAARLDMDGGPAVAYALVGSAAGEVLDTIDVWVLDLYTCEVQRVVRQG